MRLLLAIGAACVILCGSAGAQAPAEGEYRPAQWRYTLAKPEASWTSPAFDDSSWKQGEGGFGVSTTPCSTVRTQWATSHIWMRGIVELTEEQVKAIRSFHLHHDEDVEISLNGIPAASEAGYLICYEDMAIDAAALASLKPGKNLIAVHCRQTAGGQYIDVSLSAKVAPGMVWIDNYQAASLKADYEGKKLLILFVSNDSKRGEKLERVVQDFPLVRNAVKTRFIPLKLNIADYPKEAAALGVFRAGILLLTDTKGKNPMQVSEPVTPIALAEAIKRYR